MTFEITLGWWVLPLGLTGTALHWALYERPGEYGGFIPSPAPLIRLAGAVILSMAMWIAYLVVVLAWRP